MGLVHTAMQREELLKKQLLAMQAYRQEVHLHGVTARARELLRLAAHFSDLRKETFDRGDTATEIGTLHKRL